MFSVFSNTNMKQSDKIKKLQMCAGSEYTMILLAGDEKEPLYMLKPEAINTLKWINNNILFKLPDVKNAKNTQWVEVRLRIATNMLNKLENILTKDICIEYHRRLITNSRKILRDIYTEDLPF